MGSLFLLVFLSLNSYVHSAAVYNVKLWKDNIIPYQIDMGESAKKEILPVLRDIESISCVKFVDRNKGYSSWKYVRVFSGSGCYSNVGMPWKASAELSLGRGCVWGGIIRHEFFHLLGFGHEQQRYDRDKYIKVNPSHITPGMLRASYTKNRGFNYYNTTFDFESITLYSPFIALQRGGSYAWERKDISDQRPLMPGSYRDFSFWDVRTLNILYKCENYCKKKKPKCDFPNYIDRNCRCVTRKMYAQERCVDKPRDRRNCKSLASGYKCMYDRILNEQCRKSCGACFRYKNYGNAPRPDICTDRWNKRQCQSEVTSGRCKSSIKTKAFCEVSCKLKCTKPKFEYPFKRCDDKYGVNYCLYKKSQNQCDRKYCAKTCGFCKAFECVDKKTKSYCRMVVKNNRCSDLGKDCVKSCTKCGANDENDTDKHEKCIDKKSKSYCRLVVRQNRCSDLGKNCVKSCTKCGKEDTKKKCKDDSRRSWCRKVVNKKRCGDLGDRCRKSCKICICNDAKSKRYCKMVVNQDRCGDLGSKCMDSCNKC